MEYYKRIVDKELELKLSAFGATLIVGPKWCGKTTTAIQKSKSILDLQDPDKKEIYLDCLFNSCFKESISCAINISILSSSFLDT